MENNKNVNSDTDTILAVFIVGIVVGTLFTILVIYPSFGMSPTAIKSDIYKDAVEHGVGKWVINQKDTSYGWPTTKFEWITNSVEK